MIKIIVEMTFDSKHLPRLKDHVKGWVQLKVLEESDNIIVVEGRRSTLELMVREIFHYAKRKNSEVDFKWR